VNALEGKYLARKSLKSQYGLKKTVHSPVG